MIRCSMPKMYTNIRRKASDEVDLQSVTITLPKETLIELSNYGIESGRGGGNISNFLEIASLVTLGIFYNQEMAREQLARLIRADFSTQDALFDLARNLEELAKRVRLSAS